MLVIGIGNPDRGDDAVGQWVAERLAEYGVRTLSGRGETVDLMEWWAGEDDVVVIDAVSSGAEPGTIVRIDALEDSLPSEHFRGSTHAFGLEEAIELARAMDELPQRLIVYGIEGDSWEPGLELSEPVREAARELVETLVAELTSKWESTDA
jgi:hydrogenase maturation protease